MTRALDEALGGALDELSETVLPFVLARLGRASRRLRELSELVGGTSHALDESPSLAAVEEARTEADRLGWCLGVLAAARGADLLLERRERDGLRRLVEVVCSALGNLELDPPAALLPRLAVRGGRGWELPLLLGWSVCAVARAQGGPVQWSRGSSSEAAFFSFAAGGMPRERHLQLTEQGKKLCQLVAPHCTAELTVGRLLLTFPATWLEEGSVRRADDP